MNGIHDCGGTDGYGPVVPDTDEPLFAGDWEKAAFAMFPMVFAGGYFNLDEFRHSIEKMDPVHYLATPYYAHWVHVVEDYLTRDEDFARALEERTAAYLADPGKALPQTVNQDLVPLVETISSQGGSTRRDSDARARYAVGDKVHVTTDVPFTHTRKAGYVRGRTGEIVLAHGTFVYPDTNATTRDEGPTHVYTVRFTAAELYGEGVGDPRAVLNIDLWEPYLETVAA
ncbi:nitrile hydratase subunit beta [Streptomyces brasiliscabiei]|uniref:Nitrile hydratase subunit beta n=1 Tax=Streptomyces brasiliscabiei TaxID=2736302 RepID=A0ABU8GQI1_9ACTN